MIFSEINGARTIASKENWVRVRIRFGLGLELELGLGGGEVGGGGAIFLGSNVLEPKLIHSCYILVLYYEKKLVDFLTRLSYWSLDEIFLQQII